MLRFFAFVLVLILAAAASAETITSGDQVVRISSVEVPEAPAQLAKRLGKMLPEENAPVSSGENSYAVSFVGIDPPRRFASFLRDRFPDIRHTAFPPGAPMNVSLVISEVSAGSNIQLVLVMPKTRGIQSETESVYQKFFGQELPGSAEVYLSQAPSSASPGSIVLGLRQDRDSASDAYTTLLEDEGFEIERSDRQDDTFVFAVRDGLIANLVFLNDPDRKGGSIMVLQHTEE